MNYWIIVNDHHDGPYSVDTLVANGLKPEDLVWTEGLADWTPAGNILELAEAMNLRDSIVSAPAEPAAPVTAEVIEIVETEAEAPLTQEPACNVEPAQQPQPSRQTYAAPQMQTAYTQTASAQVAAMPQSAAMTQQTEPCPPAYIAWSIIVTVLCCTIVGIPAIVFASMTKSAYYRGDLAKAKRYSEITQWFIIAAIVLGAVSWPFQIAFMSL